MKQHHRMALGYCITILGGICWAIGGACGQTLFEQNRITSDWVVPIRLLLAGTLLVLFSALSGKHPMAVWKDKKNYPPLIRLWPHWLRPLPVWLLYFHPVL